MNKLIDKAWMYITTSMLVLAIIGLFTDILTILEFANVFILVGVLDIWSTILKKQEEKGDCSCGE
jgi:hypothetical protein